MVNIKENEVADLPAFAGHLAPSLYQHRQNPYSRELFGEKCRLSLGVQLHSSRATSNRLEVRRFSFEPARLPDHPGNKKNRYYPHSKAEQTSSKIQDRRLKLEKRVSSEIYTFTAKKQPNANLSMETS